jgi:arsenate reductase
MKKVYFLCTGNSCRSQIAEGYGHQFLKDWTVQSAGVETHGLNHHAVKVMAEDGVDISQQTSKLIDLDYFNSCDLIITLCGDARDKCPMIPKGIIHEHWDLADPAKAKGTEEEILEEFRKTRDLIKEKVKALSE